MRRISVTSALVCLFVTANARPAGFLQLKPLPPPAIVTASPAYSEKEYSVSHLVDGIQKTEFASQGTGTNTTVEFLLPTAARLAAIRHVDRNDPATIAESEFEFLDDHGDKHPKVQVRHVNQPGGETFYVLQEPLTVRRIRWRVTRLGAPGLGAVGGAELAFYGAGEVQTAPLADQIEVKASPFLEKDGQQSLSVAIDHLYSTPADLKFTIGTEELGTATAHPGKNAFHFRIPEAKSLTRKTAHMQFAGQTISSAEFSQAPVRQMTIYITPHSHTDIGYTEVQTAIEQKQVQNLLDGLAAAKKTANYPEGARFVWNVEVGWAADLFLQRLDPAKRAEFFAAVQNRQVVLNGMYLNELTGLCRPEELVQLFRFATRMSETTGVPIDTAMISDVPGYTWGTVTAMAQAGIKYFSTAPNYFDRIGTILQEWENKPFYWVGPDGKSKVLVWIPFWGYAMSHKYNAMSPRLVTDLYEGLEKRAYPYDIAYVRWSGHGDNAVPDPAICEFVRDWNSRYASPRFIISGASEAFHAFEARYGSQLQQIRGDWSPYWEDGAGSSALETALNRNTADQLSSAATLYALLKPAEYPTERFEQAWRNVLLYSEHTWGAWCSVSDPEHRETREQWAIKKSYADLAAAETAELLASALAQSSPGKSIEVINTLSWERSELVRVPAELSQAGDKVVDEKGQPVPSQRLRSGELAFFAQGVPPLGAQTYTVIAGGATAPIHPVISEKMLLKNGRLRLVIDQGTGGIRELALEGASDEFVDRSAGENLGDYLYLIGDDLKALQKVDSATLSVGESGPLIASLLIDSPAPGANRLRREVRLVADQDFAEIDNRLDKARLRAKDYKAQSGKESINFAFAFAIPDGELLADIPLGAFRPERDQMPSACKNWLTIGRWVEIGNRNRGVTWVSLDAPLIEAGEISATLLNSQTNPEIWRKHIAPTQKIYSWALNNHWGTNYRAYQEGPMQFRYVVRPHRGATHSAGATRFATQFTTPLIVRRHSLEPTPSLLDLSNSDVVVVGLKPSDDHRAVIVRLFGASGTEKSTAMTWKGRKPRAIFLSDTSEKAVAPIGGEVTVPGYGLVTLRAELE